MAYDAIVVGGGVAGAVAAAQLAQRGACVALIEQAAAPGWKIGETLAPEARPLLQKLGVWQEFVAACHLHCHGTVSAWGSSHVDSKDFIFNPYGHGWQLDRLVFEEMLLANARSTGAHVLQGHPAGEVRRSNGQWEVSCGDNKLGARWLLDATGKRNLAVQKVGATRQVLDALVSVHGVVELAPEQDGDRGSDSRTFIESCPDGWWYTALTSRNRRTIAFQTDADLLPGQAWRSPGWLRERLAATHLLASIVDPFSWRFVEAPMLTSAHTGRMDSFSGHGWLALGDAAMSFDPLSGQGLLKSVSSGLLAADVVAGSITQESFDERFETTWKHYAAGRLNYYAMESRWAQHEFWKRRQRGPRAAWEIAAGSSPTSRYADSSSSSINARRSH